MPYQFSSTALLVGVFLIIHYSYTPDGFLSGVDDSEGMRAHYAYDPADRLCAILKLGKEEQEPDWENVLLSGDTYRNCHGLFFLRNKRGDIETVRDGEGHARRMQYDRDGHMRNMQDEDGYLTFYGYDKNGKLRAIHYQDGRETAMQYDPLGQLVQMQDWLGSLTIERDVMGRPETVTDHTGQKTEYLWGAAGERRGMVYPDGMKVQYAYDDALRLTDITAGEPGAGGMSIHYEYSPAGQRTRKFYGSGNGAEDSAMESIRKYDSTGLLSGIIHRNREGILEQYEYTYDVRGNRQEIRKYRKDIPEDSGDFYYEYDTMRRLTGVAQDGMMLRTYSFDVYGNRKRVRDYTAGTGINYAYSASDRLLTAECRYEDGRLITTSYEYDGRGNLVLEREPAGGTEYRYAYGAINRLEKWTSTGYNETSYSYN